MVISIYVLIGFYAVLTGLAGVSQWKESKNQVRPVLFVLITISMLVILLIPDKRNMLLLLIVTFVMLHILSMAEGIRTKGKLTYSHHLFRFLFHALLLVLVYKFLI
ncbi:hypothetical protein [Jeotgalibaca caeni]|uniref:hypothetical protein n=1 Tax=Jeotgalibaca caeni TaxID=3028623 RepID=UPI00237E5114|nr:hypothetical protein [Jeotgalibaca caeni]MDE1549828.1 hypothetical protein [Jeotgalibaca caeni]